MGKNSPGGGIFSRLSSLGGILSFGGGETAVGLSIGSSSIKMVELKKAGKAWKLLHFGIVQLPDDVIVNREIVNPIAVVESLRTLVAQIRLKSKSVCTSLSGTSLIIKRMQLEIPNKKDIQDQVFWEAEQYIPFDVSEVVMDYQLLARSKDAKTDVLLVAVKKAVLESYMQAIDGAGLKPRIVDVDYFALQNLYEANYPVSPSEAVAIVDIGATSLKLVVVQNGVPVFTKDAALGGKNLTLEIQKHLNVSFADAEGLKLGGPGSGVPQEVNDLIQVMNENFATEIKRALDFYDASSTGAAVSYVLLAGGSSKLPMLSKTIEDVVGKPAQLINPFNAISYDPSVFTPDYVGNIGPIASVAMGLAIRAGSG